MVPPGVVPVTKPSPCTTTLSEFVAIGGPVPPEKVALTATAVVATETVQMFPAAVEQPDHSTLPPALGLAVRVTGVFGVSAAVHVPELHEIPPPDTDPFPLTVTDRGTSRAKVAVTV